MRETLHGVAIVGGGPAGLMAAEAAATAGRKVMIFDRMPSLARKFLMAGRGGLNLTHSEPLATFLRRYGSAADRLRPYIEAFPAQALRDWALGLGQPTFAGSSGRIFPESFKASPLLRAWLRRLAGLGVTVRTRHRLTGLAMDAPDSGAVRLQFASPEGDVSIDADACVLALGGASWPRLGSDGAWADALAAEGLMIAPLRPANAGIEIAWSGHFISRFAGVPVKPLALRFDDLHLRGEAVVTRTGLEGGAVYALCSAVRIALGGGLPAHLCLDLQPDRGLADLTARLERPRGKQSLANMLRKSAGLSPVAIALLREAGPLPADAPALAVRIKDLVLPVTGIRPLERAISSAGGVSFAEVDDRLMLRRRPGVFVAGEMLDWEAPTGGYLLQACFATGAAAGRGAAGFHRD